jgi:hypothetical protein
MSNASVQRLTRTSPVSESTRTSQNWAPHASFRQRRRSRMSRDMNFARPESRPSRVSEPTATSTDGRPALTSVAA